MPTDTTPRLPAQAPLRHGVATTPTEDGMTLVNAAGDIYTVGASGRVVIEALESGAGVTGALTALRRRYDLTAGTATTDLANLLDQLHTAKLVRAR